jgi:hypothetical protein
VSRGCAKKSVSLPCCRLCRFFGYTLATIVLDDARRLTGVGRVVKFNEAPLGFDTTQLASGGGPSLIMAMYVNFLHSDHNRWRLGFASPKSKPSCHLF